MSKVIASHLDRITEPSRLTARVVDAGPPRRIAGYEVESDLAAHYGLPDMLALLLRGELASASASRALEIALAFLAPCSVAQAPGHVGVLSRVSGSRWPVTLGLCALALAEEAASAVEEHAAWLDWVARPADTPSLSRGPPPGRALEQTEDDRASVAQLRKLLDAVPFEVAALEAGPSRIAALLAVLATCGLSREAMQTAWVVARLPAAAAEAAARPLLNVRDYPFNLPPLRYEVDE